MLHRTISPSTWWLGRASGWQRGLRAGLNSTLVLYLLVLATICALGCIYLWQANDLSQLHRQITGLEWRAAELEKENIRLVQQSARWNAPDYVEKRMQEEGYMDAQSVVYTRLPTASAQPASERPGQQVAQSPDSR